MNKHLAKGQVTVFMVLGLLILFFFFLLFYQLSIKNKDIMDITETKISNMLDSSYTKNYIDLCIENTAKKGIYLLGKQGGYIYDYQGGLTSPKYDYLAKKNLYSIITSYDFADIDPKKEYIKYNISYALYYNESKNSTYLSPPPPVYPASPNTGKIVDSNNYQKLLWPGYTIRKEIMPKQGYSWKETKYYLGDVNKFFPKLCLKEGDNYQIGKGDSFKEETSFIKSGYGCGDGSYGALGENTIQEQLQEYINNNVKDCTNFKNFSQVLPEISNLNITEGNITTNLLFGNDDINIEVSYPIEFTMSKRSSRLILKKFEVSVPIRFKQIWRHLNEILYKDSTKFSYLKTDYATIYGSRYWEDEFKYDLTPLGFDTIYTLTDEKSLIDEDYFSFNILIRNRRPALEYIHQSFILRDDLNCFDIISWPGEKIIITPEGYDPDENKLKYDYQGWNQDYTSTYSKICYNTKGSIDCTKNLRGYDECEYQEYPAPSYWTRKTGLYGIDNKTGEYDVKEKDIGIHILNVSVDDGEMKDWQELRILIFDSPKIMISAKNYYEDISNNYTSPEDYTIISSTLTSSLLSLQDFNYEAFKIDSGNLVTPSHWNFSTEEEAAIQIPRKTINDNALYPPEEIRQEMEYQFNEVGDYFLRLRASNGIEVGQSNITMEVKECLPHHVSGDIPYPYSRISNPGQDDYLADHTCCLGNIDNPDEWRIADESNICFSKTQYGSYKAFTISELMDFYNLPITEDIDDYTKIIVPAGAVLPVDNQGIRNLDSGSQNDVFKREYVRNCDGTRGNICNGTLSDEIIIQEECDDTRKGTLGTRRCSGPHPDVIDEVGINSFFASCQDYTGTTFEALINNDISAKACNEDWKCSSNTNTNGGYGAGGNYLCQATCNSGGCDRSYNCKPSCTTGETGPICEEIGNTGQYHQRAPGTCGTVSGSDICVVGEFTNCDEYACDGNSCATRCDGINNCANNYQCNMTINQCEYII